MEETKHSSVEVHIRKNGPAVIIGKVLVYDSDGNSISTERLSLCRCGLSQEMPQCDGSHKGQPPFEKG